MLQACNKSDKHNAPAYGECVRGVSQPDEMHVRDAESSNLSLRD
jgi:hypothetical protein